MAVLPVNSNYGLSPRDQALGKEIFTSYQMPLLAILLSPFLPDYSWAKGDCKKKCDRWKHRCPDIPTPATPDVRLCLTQLSCPDLRGAGGVWGGGARGEAGGGRGVRRRVDDTP